MDLHHIKQILDLVREHELSEFEIEHDGLRLKIRKDSNGSHMFTSPAPAAPVAMPSSAGAAPVAAPLQSGATTPPQVDNLGDEIELAVVKSPIVGTFYRSS